MLYLAENLKALRKGKNRTQEEAAEMLGVSPQSVSKWERGETFPDITLLPALANLYNVSVDALIGMDKINDRQARDAIFATAHEHLRSGDTTAAIKVYTDAMRIFPNDEGITSELAISLALDNDPAKLSQAIALCERMLANNQGDKVHQTTRAALCFIYLKAGEKDKATAIARGLPHIRESREMILEQLEKDTAVDEINSYLKFIAIGESNEQDIVEIDFGIDMVAVCTEHDLPGRIDALRGEIDAPKTNAGFLRLPQIRIRDNATLTHNQVRVRHYSDYLLDKEFSNASDAATGIIAALRRIAQERIGKLS